MSNGEVCCILGVCCPPDAQQAALSSALVKDQVCTPEYAEAVSAWLIARFDFAPRGTVQPLIDYVVTHARKPEAV